MIIRYCDKKTMAYNVLRYKILPLVRLIGVALLSIICIYVYCILYVVAFE